ncbi:DUF1190 domain-containing protein [Loktanella sp. M215]|uniref:DUF1190 domain-containing protein n=1 Tax=Loktanella sp. M215 TaxID=2675431 RepID=UPI001F2DD848
MTASRPLKRTRIMPAILLGATAFALAGCKDDAVEANAFPDKASCEAAANAGTVAFTVQDCDAAYQDALVEYERSAPRYDDQALCEEQHGGACVVDERAAGGGGSIFMPLMAGYLMGSMLGGNRAMTQPLYRDAGGKFATAGGGTVLNGNRGSARMQPSSFRAAPAAAAPMSRATVSKTGGFGSSRTSSFGSSRSFGG